MRGSHFTLIFNGKPPGIIPAHAGLTHSQSAPARRWWDHPRACGAHMNVLNQEVNEKGSSPRMRGSQEYFTNGNHVPGIIPAHAGLTGTWRTQPRRYRDHPRACGAHKVMSTWMRKQLGSSPRMRGSLSTSMMCSTTRRDHPRACGAHTYQSSSSSSSSGSSPRMRGSPTGSCSSMAASGIIPAHAGLTLKNPNNDAILSVSNPIFYSVLRVIL